MRILASYILRGPMQAVAVSASFGLLTLLLPPLSYLSGGAVGLVTLRHGPRQGAVVVIGAMLAMALLGVLVLGSVILPLVLAVALWLPLWALAAVLWRSGSLVLTVQLAALLGLAWVIGMHLWLGPPAVFWIELLERIRPALEQMQSGSSTAELEQRLQALAGVMTGALGAAMVVSLLLNLFLARWWQSLLFHPGGLRSELHGLRLGYTIGTLVILLIALTGLGGGSVAATARDGLWALGAVYLLCGLAVLHSLAAHLRLHTAWLVVLYGVLFIDPVHLAPFLALLGFADSWVNFRCYFNRRAES